MVGDAVLCPLFDCALWSHGHPAVVGSPLPPLTGCLTQRTCRSCQKQHRFLAHVLRMGGSRTAFPPCCVAPGHGPHRRIPRVVAPQIVAGRKPFRQHPPPDAEQHLLEREEAYESWYPDASRHIWYLEVSELDTRCQPCFTTQPGFRCPSPASSKQFKVGCCATATTRHHPISYPAPPSLPSHSINNHSANSPTLNLFPSAVTRGLAFEDVVQRGNPSCPPTTDVRTSIIIPSFYLHPPSNPPPSPR